MKDIDIARRYISKMENCISNKTIFTLSFAQFKRIMTTKHCKYTGVELVQGQGRRTEAAYCTIDRVDNAKGYVTGNVVACCYAYNQFKCVLENPTNIITFEMVEKVIKIQRSLLNKVSES